MYLWAEERRRRKRIGGGVKFNRFSGEKLKEGDERRGDEEEEEEREAL